MRELDNAQNDKPGPLDGYPAPYHDFNGITSPFGAHFILRVDKIRMKARYYNVIINSVKASEFPSVPADHADETVKFSDEACMKLVKVPRIFLTTALRGCVKWAKENGVTFITEEHMNIINDKRSKKNPID